MAYGDTVNLKPQQEGATPVVYKTAARQSIQPLVVAATWDGTGAAGDFVPAVGMYAQNGQRLGVAVLGSTVTAGDTATVSFFPGSQAASAAASSLTVTDGTTTVTGVTQLDFGLGTPVSMSAPGVAAITYPAVATAFEVFQASSASVAANTGANLSFAHSSGSSLLNFATPTQPTLLARGVYVCAGIVQLIGTGTNNVGYLGGAAFGSGTYGNPSVTGTVTGAASGHAPPTGWSIPLTLVSNLAAGDTFQAAVRNLDTVSQNFAATFTLSQLFTF